MGNPRFLHFRTVRNTPPSGGWLAEWVGGWLVDWLAGLAGLVGWLAGWVGGCWFISQTILYRCSAKVFFADQEILALGRFGQNIQPCVTISVGNGNEIEDLDDRV